MAFALLRLMVILRRHAYLYLILLISVSTMLTVTIPKLAFASKSNVTCEELFENQGPNNFNKQFPNTQETIKITDANLNNYQREIVSTSMEFLWMHKKNRPDGHIYLRMGEKIFSYWPNSGWEETSLKYVLWFSRRMKYQLQGVVLSASTEEISSSVKKFEQIKNYKVNFDILTNNCASVVCGVLRQTNIKTPLWLLETIPWFVLNFYKKSSQFLFSTDYQ